jgi:hypothetical protein
MNHWRKFAPGSVCLVLLALAGCGRAVMPEVSSTDGNLEDRPVRVSGPYGHANLTFFLIHADQKDARDFLTLDEGLANGQVQITESEQEQVQKLVIDNQSDKPLYLQEGERIQGGKQDRTIAASLVIAPHSGKQSLPAFCIEQSRWRAGKDGARFANPQNMALAPKGVRGAAKYEKEQQKVWANVGAVKMTGGLVLNAKNTNSSANELLDAPEVEAVLKEYTSELAELLDKHPDAVGVAVAVNGQFEEADVYPSHSLFRKVGPRLVQSYALQASLLKDEAKDAPTLTADAVLGQLQKRDAKAHHEERLDGRNLLDIRELPDNAFACTTRYEGREVNWQVMKKNGAAPGPDGPGAGSVGGAPARAAKLGTDW